MGIRVTILMRVVISKLLDDKVTFETRLKEGLRDSHMGIGEDWHYTQKEQHVQRLSAGEYMQIEEQGDQGW